MHQMQDADDRKKKDLNNLGKLRLGQAEKLAVPQRASGC